MSKDEFRRATRELLRGIARETRRLLSRNAAERLVSQEEWKKSDSVLLYLPLGDELDVLDCVNNAHGKTFALPRYNSDRGVYTAAAWRPGTGVVRGPFGVSEPPPDAPEVALNQLDLLLVPGLAFDLAGRRLGRGKGFYDRLLAETGGLKCGVALDEQIVPELPSETHDIPMNCILTPTRWITTAPVC